MIVYIFLAIVILAILYFTVIKPSEESSDQDKNKQSVDVSEEISEKQNLIDKKSQSEQVQQQNQQTSFKKLKQKSKGGNKKGKGNQPEHESYITAFKGFKSAIVDYDHYTFDDSSFLIVIGEEQSQVKAFFVNDIEKEADFLSAQAQIQAGTNIVSVSLGPLNVVDSSQFKMLVSVASFDQCRVLFYELSLQEKNGKKQLTLSQIQGRELTDIHKFPVRLARLSKKNANLLVSCGDESDLFVKLWNTANSTKGGQPSEPVNTVQTNQIKHKNMSQGQECDYFAVATKSSEIKIFQIQNEKGVIKGLVKVMALTLHKRESLSISFDPLCKYCVTTALDQLMIIYELNDYYKQAKPLLQKSITSLSEMKVSAIEVCAFSQNIVKLFVAVSDGASVEIYEGIIIQGGQLEGGDVKLIMTIDDAQSDNVVQMHLYFDKRKEELFLITSAKLDPRLNIFKIQ